MRKLNLLLQSKRLYIFLIFFIIIYVIVFTRIIKYHSKYSINDNVVSGIIKFYKFDGDKLSLKVKGKETIIINYYFKTEEEKKHYINSININDKIIVNGEIKQPINNTIPNTFNYKEYLYNKGIFYTFNASRIEKVRDGISIKNILLKRVKRIKNNEYLYSLVLGDNSYIDGEIYQDLGVSHLFSISGMHVSLLSDFLEKKLKINHKVSIFILFIYMYLIGFSVGVLRVVLFKLIKMIFKKVGVKLNNKSILFFTAVVLLLINPFYIYNLGFIYSFAVTGSIMLFEYKKGYLLNLLKISIVAFSFSFPITAYVNYQVNILSIFSNLLYVPFVTIILFPLAILTFIFPFIQDIFIFFVNIMEWVNKVFPTYYVIMPKLFIGYYLLYYIGLWLTFYKKRRYILVIFILLSIHKTTPYFNKSMSVYFIDVGQGDSTLLVYPRLKKTILIDCGGKLVFEKAKWQQKKKINYQANNIANFLKSLGISKLDLFVASHGDYDHIGNYQELSNKISIEHVLINNGEINPIESIVIKSNERLKTINDPYLFLIEKGRYNNENDNSIVLKFVYNDFKILFLGDVSSSVEKTLNVSADIVKLAHHGSKNSSNIDFLNRTNCKTAIISSGRNNIYNHPDHKVIKNLEALNIKYYNTQDRGTILFRISKNSRTFYFYPP